MIVIERPEIRIDLINKINDEMQRKKQHIDSLLLPLLPLRIIVKLYNDYGI